MLDATAVQFGSKESKGKIDANVSLTVHRILVSHKLVMVA